MSWLRELFHTDKPIIAMCHLHAMPGDPHYDPTKGVQWVVDRGREDLLALQEGGVDAVMFSNEYSLPYVTDVETSVVATMARIIGELKSEITVPYGVNVLWDPVASIDLAAATGARFVREIFTGVYASDFGLWNTNCGEVIRHRQRLHADDVRLLFNIVPEAAAYLGNRTPAEIARSTVFNAQPDALCVSGMTAGVETSV
ncbi:MAG: BtpA/SgcQ family protein, partial [Spirochaetales bacterium]|nr:BtpA/SgcQ family protein [Spirochaetales bacterium]